MEDVCSLLWGANHLLSHLALLQSTGGGAKGQRGQSIGSQEQVQHENTRHIWLDIWCVLLTSCAILAYIDL